MTGQARQTTTRKTIFYCFHREDKFPESEAVLMRVTLTSFFSDLIFSDAAIVILIYEKEFLVLVIRTVTLNCISRWNSAIRVKIQRNKSDPKRWILVIKQR